MRIQVHSTSWTSHVTWACVAVATELSSTGISTNHLLCAVLGSSLCSGMEAPRVLGGQGSGLSLHTPPIRPESLPFTSKASRACGFRLPNTSLLESCSGTLASWGRSQPRPCSLPVSSTKGHSHHPPPLLISLREEVQVHSLVLKKWWPLD